MSAPRSTRVPVDGWLVLDKPVGMTSTHAVSRLKRIFNAKKAGHAGTLDPLASGILPVAFGEATKTVPFVQDGKKAYRFTVKWGVETDTDDTEGKPARESATRPTREAVLAALPRFTGTIMQVPPAFSAIKVDGERAYDLARDGETVELSARPIEIHALDLVSFNPEEAVLEARCGKGTYVRAIARDLGRDLGCLGHVTALRRTRVGPFLEADAVDLQALMPGRRGGGGGAAGRSCCAAGTGRRRAPTSTPPAAARRWPSESCAMANSCRAGCSIWSSERGPTAYHPAMREQARPAPLKA